METITIKVKSEKAAKLIRDLEALEILEVIETTYLRKKAPLAETSSLSELKNKISIPMKEEAINAQLEKIRNEWQRDI